MSTWDQTFRAISGGNRAEFGGDFSSPFGLGVVDLIPTKNPQPYVPSDPNPPTIDHTVGFGFSNPFAATPGATPEEQKQKDKALLIKVAFGGAGLLVLLSLLGGGSRPISVPLATAPTPRPGNININLERFGFARRKKK